MHAVRDEIWSIQMNRILYKTFYEFLSVRNESLRSSITRTYKN